MVWEMAAEDHSLAHVNSIKHAHTHTHTPYLCMCSGHNMSYNNNNNNTFNDTVHSGGLSSGSFRVNPNGAVSQNMTCY